MLKSIVAQALKKIGGEMAESKSRAHEVYGLLGAKMIVTVAGHKIGITGHTLYGHISDPDNPDDHVTFRADVAPTDGVAGVARELLTVAANMECVALEYKKAALAREAAKSGTLVRGMVSTLEEL
jgi:hypothetical protein